jgi:hypothetical protein
MKPENFYEFVFGGGLGFFVTGFDLDLRFHFNTI